MPGDCLERLRKALGLYANLRPVKPHPKLLGASSIKPEVLAGVDMIVIRELTGGIYFGEKTKREPGTARAISASTKRRGGRAGRARPWLREARAGSGAKKLTSVDKANVLEDLRGSGGARDTTGS